MGKGLSRQQRDILACLEANWITDIEDGGPPFKTVRRREMLPVRDLRELFLDPNQTWTSAKHLATIERACRRSLQSLERRGLVEFWTAPVHRTTEEVRDANGTASTVLVWRVHQERRPGETEQLRCAAITDAGIALIRQDQGES
jgi:hypothetical protein